MSIGNKVYAIPFEIELIGLYYDADVLQAAGVEPPKSWDDLKQAAMKLKTDKRAGITIEVSKGAYQTFTWYPFMWMTGADVFTSDLKHSALDNPGVAKALQLWKDLIESGAANLRPSRSTTDIGILGDGETAMQICGSWSIPTIENQYKDKNIKLVRLPIPDGGKPANVAGGWKFMVNAKGKYPADAAKFAVWAFGENLDIPLKWTTVTKFAYSPRKSVMDAGKAVFSKGLREVFATQIYGTEKPEIRMPAEASSIIEDMVQNAMFNKDYDGQRAAMEAHQKLEAFLKEFPGQIYVPADNGEAPVSRWGHPLSGGTMRRMRRDRLQEALSAYTMLLPDVVGLLIFVFIPIVYAFIVSLHSWNGLKAWVYTGGANYRHLLGDTVFWRSLLTTVRYAVLYVPAVFIISFALAVLVNAIKGTKQQVFRTLLFVPFAISTVVAALAWSFIYDPMRGYLNGLLGLFRFQRSRSWARWARRFPPWPSSASGS